jgi:hypothetical protein
VGPILVTGVVIPFVTAVVGAAWKVLARPAMPSGEDRTIAFELLLAAAAFQSPYVVAALYAESRPDELEWRLGGLGLVSFSMLGAALWLRLGYEPTGRYVCVERSGGELRSREEIRDLSRRRATWSSVMALLLLGGIVLFNWYFEELWVLVHQPDWLARTLGREG